MGGFNSPPSFFDSRNAIPTYTFTAVTSERIYVPTCTYVCICVHGYLCTVL